MRNGTLIKMFLLLLDVLLHNTHNVKGRDHFPGNSLHSHQLYFHGVGPNFDVAHSYNVLMAFEENFWKEISYNQSYKHSQPYHIVYAKVYSKLDYFFFYFLFKTFYQHSLHPKTVFVIDFLDFDLNNRNLVNFMPDTFIASPATKFALIRSQGTVDTKYLCHSHSESQAALCDANNLKLEIDLQQPLLLHKQLFRNGRREVVLIEAEEDNEWLTGCKNGIFQAFQCDSKAEAALLILRIYNLTVIKLNYNKFNKYNSPSFIIPSTSAKTFGGRIQVVPFTPCILYLGNLHYQLVYCQVPETDCGTRNGSIWTAGISLMVSFLLVCTGLITCATICIKCRSSVWHFRRIIDCWL